MDVHDSHATTRSAEANFDDLQAEIERLRSLVGPSELSYEQLRSDAQSARDAARKAEFEAGRARAEIVRLENDIRRWQRDFVWFRDRVIRRLPLLSRFLNVFRRP